MSFFRFSQITDPIETIRFSNGLSVVLHRFSSPAVGFSILIKCGPVFENTANNGISHFLEHMLFRGVPAYPSSSALGFALDKIGSEANAATFSDMTIISSKVLPESLEDASLLFYSMITEPVFDGLKAEKNIILEECLEDYDEDGQLVAMDQLSSQMQYGDHPYSFPILGNDKIIKEITTRHLTRHLREFYIPENMVVCLAGGFHRDKALKIMKTVFGNSKSLMVSRTAIRKTDKECDMKKPWEVAPVFSGPCLQMIKSPRSQIQCRISFKALPFSAPDFYVEKALIRILDCSSGSPLREIMQDEKGFCYALSVGTDAYENGGAVHVDFSVQPEAVVNAVSTCLQVFEKMSCEPPSGELIAHMIAQYIKGKRFASTDLWDFSSRYSFRALYPTAHPFAEEFLATQKLDSKIIHAMAKRIFRRSNLGITLIGPLTSGLKSSLNRILKNFPA